MPSLSSRKSTIGFDIGTTSIKAVEMSMHDRSLEVKRWGLEDIQNNDCASALKKLCQRMDIKDQISAASVSGKGTLIRYVDMPKMSIEELKKSFSYEVDKYFPFEPQSIYTDCFIIDPATKDKKLSVLVVAAKKELVDERVRWFREAGLELNYVTTNSIATANAFERLVKKTVPGPKGILDIGGNVSNLMILDKNNSPSFTRDIFTGSNDMSKQISNSLGIDFQKADEIKKISKEKADALLKACENILDNLVGETHLSFDYFMTEKNIQVSELYLVGGGALLKGIESVFEKSLNLPVKVWDPLADVRLSPQVQEANIQSYGPQLGVAIGLALTKL